MDLVIWSLGVYWARTRSDLGISLRARGTRGLLWGSRVWVHNSTSLTISDLEPKLPGVWGLLWGLESSCLLWGSGVCASTGPEALILDLEQHTPNFKQN